jgi:hypothetical protein
MLRLDEVSSVEGITGAGEVVGTWKSISVFYIPIFVYNLLILDSRSSLLWILPDLDAGRLGRWAHGLLVGQAGFF